MNAFEDSSLLSSSDKQPLYFNQGMSIVILIISEVKLDFLAWFQDVFQSVLGFQISLWNGRWFSYGQVVLSCFLN